MRTLTLLVSIMASFIAGPASANSGSPVPDARWSEYLEPALDCIYPEEEAIANPPFFHWKAHPGAAGYELHLAGPDRRRKWETGRNFFLPEAPLGPGIYRIEVRALDSRDEPIAASTRDFRIGPEVLVFPLPLNGFSHTAGEAKIVSDEIISRIRSGKGGRALYRDKLLEMASRGLPKNLLHTAEPPLYPDGVWDRDLWSRKNALSYRIEDGITQQALAFRLTGGAKYREAAVALMLEAASFPATGSLGVWESDHAAHSMLRSLSVGYDLLRNDLSEAEAEPIRAAIRDRSRDMYAFLNPFVGKRTPAETMNDPDNNHPWFCASALAHGGLALLDYEDEAGEWVAFASQLFAGVFLPRGDRQGGWHEGIDYWSYSLFFVCQFADALRTATGIDFYDHPWLRNTGAFKMLTHPTAGAWVPFGNCKHNPPDAFDKLVMKRFASIYQDPLLWKYVDAIPAEITHSRHLFFACIWTDRDRETAHDTAPDLPRFVHYEDMGWVVANSDPFDAEDQVLFAFRSGPFFGRAFGHSHGDQNHFILAAGGEKLIWDSGYYDGYLTPHHREFAVRSEAHNTILVNGTGQVVHVAGTDGRIAAYEQDGNSLRVTGDASEPLIYGGRLVRFLRHFEFDDWRKLRVSNDIFARELSHLSWMLQSVYPIEYDTETGTIRIEGERYAVEGVFETEHEVEIKLHHGFPVEPNRPAGREHLWPDQYRLEITTSEKVRPGSRRSFSTCTARKSGNDQSRRMKDRSRGF